MGCAPPFSRRAGRERSAPDRWDFARALEAVASSYGWGPEYVELAVTDEQLVVYLDSFQERIDAQRAADFDSWVDAVRLGTVFAHDARQYSAWRARTRRSGSKSRGLTGAALEAAVARVADMFPSNVIRETA